MTKVRFNPQKRSHQLIASAMVEMVRDEGLTPHEALEAIEGIKNDIFFSLFELKRKEQPND
ncbi:hypothetical protein BK133_00985 [Paenibacillus sp. FSL H8-0548]|uniref:hypothetical protein n=1 Tax=Paenibacillus sp. FSL H8-0548 TaxID=1920422 RepID=UPI00096FC22E|nr:hypothetical protein [Paenibacillus sp. FSL H8-0548]OMF38809.1 hypothetical protein BK133_00985 [Paenibacillus sp. FSL H8-0548]